MFARLTVLTVLLALILGTPVSAQGSTVLYGPVNGHQALELGATVAPLLVTIWVDDFNAGRTTQPSFIGDLEGSQAVLEVGPAWQVGPIQIGAGLRTWMSRLEGTQEYLRIYWTDSFGREVSFDVSHDGYGKLLDGYEEHKETATRRATAEQDSATELAVLVAGAVESGSWVGAVQASYATSGFAWRLTGGYRLGDVVLTAGYRSWPMDRFYAGPMVGVELQF